jgi:predicted lipid-binding transport protein (Tim44 family)
MAMDEDNNRLVISQAPDMMDQHEFVEKARSALDDMADVYDPDDGRTLEEWIEELKTTIHNND